MTKKKENDFSELFSENYVPPQATPEYAYANMKHILQDMRGICKDLMDMTKGNLEYSYLTKSRIDMLSLCKEMERCVTVIERSKKVN